MVEQVCDRFETAWKAGERPRLEAYIEQVDETARTPLLRELVSIDWEYRIRTGDVASASDYEARFPSLGALLEKIGIEVASATSSRAGQPQRFAQYKVVRELGRGGMGVVYEAEHQSLGRRVAIKVLPTLNVTDFTSRERFRREAQLTARLHHPNIVQIFEVGEHKGQPFLALEFVHGPSLRERLRQSPQPPREAAAIVATLARAIHYAHEQGIVHRDLKPANVLLADPKTDTHVSASDGTNLPVSLSHYIPKVTDFGLAQPVGEGDITATGAIVGTPAYMAPEQASGKSKQQLIGPSVDIYALGAILYEIISGRPVFQGVTALEALDQVRTQEPVSPMRLQPLVPRDLDTICLKCLEKEPAKRYSSAQSLADDLQRFLSGEPIAARRSRTGERVKRWCRRNQSLVVAGVLGVVALLSAMGLAINYAFTIQIQREQQLTQSALEDANFQRSRAEQNANNLVHQEALTRAALVDAERFRKQAERQSADFALERGLSLLDQGDVARGMLMLGRSLELAQPSATELEHVIRSNLSAAQNRFLYQLRLVLDHGGEAQALAFSPDGKSLWTGSRVNPPQRWNVHSGLPEGAPLPHNGEIRAIEVSADGRLVATASTDKTARLWESATGKPYGKPLEHKHWVHAVAFNSDGSLVVTGSADGTARLWEAATGELRGTFLPPGWIQSVAFSPDGQTIAMAAGPRVWLYDAGTTKQVGEPMAHPGEVWTIAFKPDGKVLLTGCEDGTARLWEANSGKPLGFPLLHQGPVRSVGYSHDGTSLWSGDATGRVRMWDTVKMAPLGIPLQNQSAIYAVAMNSDQTCLATGSADGKVRLWQKAPAQTPARVLPHERLAYCVAVSPDGKSVATGTADQQLRIWDVATGKRVGNPMSHDASILGVAFSPDGKTILTASSDKTARLWNFADNTQRGTPLPHDDHVYAVAFSPDGEFVVTSAKDSTARRWNASTGAPIGSPLIHPHWVHAVAVSPDSKTILTGCEDARARLWDARTGAELGEPLQHRGPVRSVAFSPDGSKIVTGTWDDGMAQVWDVTKRTPVGPPMPHQEHVLAVEFSPNGKSVATGTWDGTARLWDVATGKPLGPPLEHQRTIRDVTFSPDGNTLWTAAFDRTVRAWTLPQPIKGDVDQVVLWIQALTGIELNSDGLFRDLDATAWQQKQSRLNQQ